MIYGIVRTTFVGAFLITGVTFYPAYAMAPGYPTKKSVHWSPDTTLPPIINSNKQDLSQCLCGSLLTKPDKNMELTLYAILAHFPQVVQYARERELVGRAIGGSPEKMEHDFMQSILKGACSYIRTELANHALSGSGYTQACLYFLLNKYHYAYLAITGGDAFKLEVPEGVSLDLASEVCAKLWYVADSLGDECMPSLVALMGSKYTCKAFPQRLCKGIENSRDALVAYSQLRAKIMPYRSASPTKFLEPLVSRPRL